MYVDVYVQELHGAGRRHLQMCIRGRFAAGPRPASPINSWVLLREGVQARGLFPAPAGHGIVAVVDDPDALEAVLGREVLVGEIERDLVGVLVGDLHDLLVHLGTLGRVVLLAGLDEQLVDGGVGIDASPVEGAVGREEVGCLLYTSDAADELLW